MVPEPSTRYFAQPKLRQIMVRVCTVRAIYRGTFYIPEVKKRLSDALNDERAFLSLTDVTEEGSNKFIKYLAVNKNLIESVEILAEEDSSAPPPG